MTHTPAVDSLEQASNENLLTRLRILATDHAPGSLSRITIQQAIAALTRPPGGSERLRSRLNNIAARLENDGDEHHAAEVIREAAAALASPQGAEQRQEAVAYRYRHSALENWHYGDHPKSWWECQPLYATPHPEPAATQGDAVERFSPTIGDYPGGHFEDAEAEMVATTDGEYVRYSDYLATLSSPPGVQAAQVSDAVATIIRDVCELDPADPDDPAAVCLLVRDLRTILEAALAHPGSAAHGGEVSGAG